MEKSYSDMRSCNEANEAIKEKQKEKEKIPLIEFDVINYLFKVSATAASDTELFCFMVCVRVCVCVRKHGEMGNST